MRIGRKFIVAFGLLLAVGLVVTITLATFANNAEPETTVVLFDNVDLDEPASQGALETRWWGSSGATPLDLATTAPVHTTVDKMLLAAYLEPPFGVEKTTVGLLVTYEANIGLNNNVISSIDNKGGSGFLGHNISVADISHSMLLSTSGNFYSFGRDGHVGRLT